MLRALLISALLCLNLLTAANDRKYSIATLPAQLTEKANVVKRLENIRFIINNIKSTVIKRHYAITILNSKGEKHAALNESYDKLNKITKIEGSLYDAEGNLIKKLKSKEIRDVSAASDINFMEDSRIKSYNFNYHSYPYTVEYVVEQSINHTFNFPAWVPVHDENFSVEQSSFTIEAPEKYTFRNYAFNYKSNPAIKTLNGRKTYIWELKMQKALQLGFASASWREISPVVYFAPGDFEIEGYKGNMNTWAGYGQFIQSLNAGKNVLPATMKQKVQQIVSGKTEVQDKIKALYEYMQKNTRYISIQLGLGGWQPFNASYVHTKGYGDCKALTIYMQSLLTEVDIPSSYVLIYAGESSYAKNRLIEDFPANQFNHAILCIPTGKDSMWLECTSQTLPAGYVSGFTANRKALMITPNGGEIVHTPRYANKENVQSRKIKAQLSADNQLEIFSLTTYSSEQQDELSQMLVHLNKEKVEELLQNRYALSTYKINDFKYNSLPSTNPVIEETLHITALNYANISGKRIFIKPNIMNRQRVHVAFDSSRTADFVFHYAFTDSDEVEISVPEGYVVEAIPRDTVLTSDLGVYSIKTSFQDNKLFYRRVWKQNAVRLPVADQSKIVDFLHNVTRYDALGVVLVKM